MGYSALFVIIGLANSYSSHQNRLKTNHILTRLETNHILTPVIAY